MHSLDTSYIGTYYVPSISIYEYILLFTKGTLKHLLRNVIVATAMPIHNNVIFNENIVKIK